MPSLNWELGRDLAVVDERDSSFLIVNRRTGRWCKSNRAGVQLFQTQPKEQPLHELLCFPENKPISSGELGRGDQFFVIYKLTDKCNFHCSYCYDRLLARRKDSAARDRNVRLVLDRLLSKSTNRINLLFHGGEPFLEFAELRAIVTEYSSRFRNQLSFSVQTNMSLLTPELLEFLVEKQVGISVSVDGATTSANKMRVIGGQEDPYQTLLRMSSPGSVLRRDRVGLLLTVGPHNCDQVAQSLVTMQDDGFTSVSFSLLQPVNSCAMPASGDALISMYRDICQEIAAERLTDLAVWSVIQWANRLVDGQGTHVCMTSPCGAGRSVITVFPSGEVGPCDSIYDASYYSPDPEEYWRNDQPGSTLHALRSRNLDEIEPCRSCDVKPFCNGTCPGSVVLERGQLEGVATHECAFQYRWIRELMWILTDSASGAAISRYCSRHNMLRAHYLRGSGPSI